jgi:hypothetical protein
MIAFCVGIWRFSFRRIEAKMGMGKQEAFLMAMVDLIPTMLSNNGITMQRMDRYEHAEVVDYHRSLVHEMDRTE